MIQKSLFPVLPPLFSCLGYVRQAIVFKTHITPLELLLKHDFFLHHGGTMRSPWPSRKSHHKSCFPHPCYSSLQTTEAGRGRSPSVASFMFPGPFHISPGAQEGIAVKQFPLSESILSLYNIDPAEKMVARFF